MTQVAAEDAVRAALGACIATLDAVEHEAAWRLPATLEHASNTGWIGLGSAGLMLQVTGADITRTLICLGARTALDAYRAALTTLGGAT